MCKSALLPVHCCHQMIIKKKIGWKSEPFLASTMTISLKLLLCCTFKQKIGSFNLFKESNFRYLFAGIQFHWVYFQCWCRTQLLNLVVLEKLRSPLGVPRALSAQFSAPLASFCLYCYCSLVQTIAQASLVSLKESSSARLFAANNSVISVYFMVCWFTCVVLRFNHWDIIY